MVGVSLIVVLMLIWFNFQLNSQNLLACEKMCGDQSGELVRIKAISEDVSHGIAIPKIGFNLRIDPGRTSIGEFVAPSPGEYVFGCSVVCGPGHHAHAGKLVVI